MAFFAPILPALATLKWPAITMAGEKISDLAQQWLEIMNRRKSRPERQPSDTPEAVEDPRFASINQSLEELRTTVEQLEENDIKQAELASQIATQMEELSQAIQVISDGVLTLEKRDKLLQAAVVGVGLLALAAILVALIL